eukprot:388233-Amorphochlora_amoeboformis.AAC.1
MVTCSGQMKVDARYRRRFAVRNSIIKLLDSPVHSSPKLKSCIIRTKTVETRARAANPIVCAAEQPRVDAGKAVYMTRRRASGVARKGAGWVPTNTRSWVPNYTCPY